MKTKRGLNPKLFVSLLVVALLLMGMPSYAQAFDSHTSGNNTTISLDPGENTFTYDVVFNDIEQPFASAEFTITVSNGNYIRATGITFKTSIRNKASGTVNTISTGGRANGNQVTYKAGFVSTENQFSEELTVGTIEFSYTGTIPQTVTLNNLKLERFTGNTVDGLPELERTEESWSKTITVSSDTPTVAAPTANPLPGAYSFPQSVTLSSTTAGAKIYYTVNGSKPTGSSTLYFSPITVNNSMTIKAFAVKEGYQDSEVQTFSYTISSDTPTVAAPTANPLPGAYSSPQSVTLSSTTAGAKIYYTVN
ncbi:MAG: chitobiase/beta-hexosaminidase C-terminal domain-containing protein, partial [Dehalobacterium sp.]